jgi:hypothetical protein
MARDTTPKRAVIERTPENDAIYRHIRSEMQFEINMMHARVNWLIASQAFLFVPLTIGAQGSSITQSALFPLVPYLGLLLCILVSIAVLASAWRSVQWRAKGANGAYGGDGEHNAFSIVVPRSPLIPLMGLTGAIGVPVVLAGAWLVLLFWPPGPTG